MEIIESYKKKARESLANVLSSIHDEDEEGLQTATEESNPMRKQLIQEINAPEPTVEADYQAQQFQFFTKIVKEKPNKCVVCKKISPKYTCPKCKVRYCSSDHFKTHNLFCTELFYKGEVEALMKRTKAAAGEKKKMVEFLKVHGEEMAQSQGQVMDESKIEEISQKRLEEIMAALQEGREVNLNDNQMRCFERYLKEIQECSLEQQGPKNEKSQGQDEGQAQLFEEYVPFWQVQEGLEQYFLIDQPIPIENFNKSQHKALLQYRQQASSKFRKDLVTFSRGISFKKTSIFVAYDVVQITYLISLLFRTYNGDYLTNPDFPENFLKLYQEDLSKKIAESQPINVSELVLSSFPEVLPFLKIKMADLESDLLEVLKSWLPFMVDDSMKILKNKYLCLEALYRMLEMYRSRTNKNKKQMNSQAKMIKKLEFLLTFTSQILYAPPKDNQKLPEQFIEINALKLIQNILQRDKKSEQQQAKAIKVIREAQNNQKQKKIQQFLIS